MPIHTHQYATRQPRLYQLDSLTSVLPPRRATEMVETAGKSILAKLLRLDNPVGSLTLAFLLWKALLFVVITLCPGPGYDTSTTLIAREGSGLVSSPTEPLPPSLKFVRWDSIYFLHIAEKGYVFEQEWAFSYPRILGLFVSGTLSQLTSLNLHIE